MVVLVKFNRQYKNDTYQLLFNTQTGVEVLEGINGNEDPFVTDLPTLLDVGIMGECIHTCPFCYQGHVNKPNMKLGHFQMIIDQVKHHTNQIALGGRGDPNKHEHFREILEYCRKNNVVPNYTTSGIDLTDEEIEISKLCGAVAVSDYEQYYTYSAIRKFMDAGIKTNIHQIFSNKSFNKCLSIVSGYNPWMKSGNSLVDTGRLNAVIFLLFKAQGAGKSLIELIPTKEQLDAFADQLFCSNLLFKVGLDSCFVNKVIDNTKITPAQKISIDTCEASRMSGYITPDMKFKPCSFANIDSEISLLDSSLEKIWKDGKPFLDFRNTLKQTKNSCPIGL